MTGKALLFWQEISRLPALRYAHGDFPKDLFEAIDRKDNVDAIMGGWHLYFVSHLFTAPTTREHLVQFSWFRFALLDVAWFSRAVAYSHAVSLGLARFRSVY